MKLDPTLIKIGELKTGEEIIVLKREFTPLSFREFLTNLLTRNLTEETRMRIETALTNQTK